MDLSHSQAIYGNPQNLKPVANVGGHPGGATGEDGVSSETGSVLSADLLLMGIMASDVRLALRGFRDWCDALGVEFVLPENRVSRPVG